MAEKNEQGTTNMLTGKISKGPIGAAPVGAETPIAVPSPLESLPEIVTHAEMLEGNKKRWPGYSASAEE